MQSFRTLRQFFLPLDNPYRGEEGKNMAAEREREKCGNNARLMRPWKAHTLQWNQYMKTYPNVFKITITYPSIPESIQIISNLSKSIETYPYITKHYTYYHTKFKYIKYPK